MDTPRPSLSLSAERNVIGIVWILILVLGLVPPFLRETHTDIAWPFYLVNQMLHGARQGRDFLEVNPPLFLWLAAPSVLLENATGIPAGKWNVHLTTLIALLSLYSANSILRALDIGQPGRWRLLTVAGFAALVLPRTDFAQREHLAFLFSLPFTLLAAARLRKLAYPGLAAAGIGVLGAIGFSLKPFFLIAWILLEALLWSRIGTAALRRTELWALVVFGLAYLTVLLVTTPEYVSMAFRLRAWYNVYLDNGLAGALMLAGPVLLFTVLVALSMRVSAPSDDPTLAALTMVFLGFLVGAVLQEKGLNYHYIAVSCFGQVLLARGMQILGRLKRPFVPSALFARVGALLLVVVIGGATLDATFELRHPGDDRYRSDPNYPRLLPVVKELAVGQPILVLSSNPASGWPLTKDAGATWASRYMSLWPMAAIYHQRLWDNVSRIVETDPLESRVPFEREFNDEVIADLERWPPRLIIVLEPDSTVQAWGGATRFDYLAYFRADPRFAKILADFDPDRSVGPYTIWIRRGTS